MAGDPFMWESQYGAGWGYAAMNAMSGYYDVADAEVYPGMEHTHFIVWLAVFALAAVAVLGGLKVSGLHFVVKV
jgi:hypothetical protein